MTISNKDISKFYDDYTRYQKNMGVHIRHRTILKNLKNAGLQKNSTVLEIGCGIGTVTHLIAAYCTGGKITAVDISAESINMAKKLNTRFKNISFEVSDMGDFSKNIKYDFVVLPDVLEHIPIENHFNLFKTLKAHTHENSVILINIPSPHYLRWVHKNNPKELQIIDQPLNTDELLNNVYPNDFYMYSLQTYALSFKEGDYQSIVLKRNKELVKLSPLSKYKKAVMKRVAKFY